MLKSLHIQSFKSFSDAHIDLAGLTLLSGFNNSGKSTVMQAARIGLGQEIFGSSIGEMGGYEELKSKYSPVGEDISITLENSTGNLSSFTWKKGTQHSQKKPKNRPTIEFISADRLGPRVELPLIGEHQNNICLGEKGEHSAHYAYLFENCLVNEILLHPKSQSRILKHQLIAWMGEISPGVRLDFDIHRKFDSSRLEVNGNRAVNSGFGISYALPIVLAALVMTANPKSDNIDQKAISYLKNIRKNSALLLVENPEAHLHPSGQTLLGKLLALACTQNIQIVAESHSDHFLDGIRLAMKSCTQLDEKDIKIYFFSKSKDGPPTIDPITLRKNGSLSQWPSGFFDQMTKNLRELTSSNNSNDRNIS